MSIGKRARTVAANSRLFFLRGPLRWLCYHRPLTPEPAMQRTTPKFALAVVVALLSACATQPNQPSGPQPPLAAQHPFDVQSPNGVRIDNYYWLRDDSRTKPEMLDYLKAENAYYTAMTAHTKALEDSLYTEIVGRIKQDDATVPAKFKHYWYYTRFEQGGEYPIYARRQGSESGPEQVMLDGNVLAQGHDFFQISENEISPGEQLLAYAEDT